MVRGIWGCLMACVLALSGSAWVHAQESAAASDADTADVQRADGAGALPRIVNGTVTGAYESTGALLLGNNPNTATLNCSGVMIGCSTFLTAAHCVCPTKGTSCQPPNEPDPSTALVFLQHAGFFTVDEIIVHPDYLFPVADLAIVKLAIPVSGIPPAKINLTSPTIPSTGQIVGFGRTGGGGSNTDFGVKRVGNIVSTDCLSGLDDELICWNFFDLEGSNTCGGDSGGPLFMDLGAGPVVAGITSGGNALTCLPDDHSFDVDVAHYASWIQSVGGADLANVTCGAGTQVGQPETAVFHQAGIIVGPGDVKVHSFALSAGSTQLRIAMNGHDSGESDFNMLVRRGAPPTASLFDCQQNGPGQYGYCQFNSPAGGTWYVRIDPITGSGQYQVTVTDTGAPPPTCGNSIAEPGEVCDGTDDSACEGLCQPDCQCPVPVCGNAVAEVGEQCDGPSDATCAVGCESDCTCTCLTQTLQVIRSDLNQRRMLLKANLVNTGGEYTGLDPRLGFRVEFSDGVNLIQLSIPGGDPGWLKSRPEKGRFKWKGDIGGLRGVSLKDATDRKGVVSLRLKGKRIIGSETFNDVVPMSIKIILEDVCTATICGDGLINESAREDCDDQMETATCDIDCTFVACGDATPNLTAGEQCDDGGESPTCDLNCTLAFCGDATVNHAAGEECDDANGSSADRCPASCKLATCGDGFLCTHVSCNTGPTGGTEICDNGAANSDTVPDACRTNCRPAYCGDDVTDTGEACDDGGASATCDADCTLAVCGDGTPNAAAGETCDTGGESATCDPDCTSVFCGDAYINAAAGEECDDQNANFNDACPTTCKIATCGDGFLCTFPNCTSGPTGGAEQCDQGANNSDTIPNRCRTDCAAAGCGDSVVDSGETCDAGGESASCDDDCTPVSCGDQNTNEAAGEQCDDGNASNTDPCLTGCIAATCGDGFLCSEAGCTSGPNGGLEACDNGGANSDVAPNACRTDCSLPSCGDGVTDSGEQCDDAGESATCDADCTFATCGDGTVNPTAGETCDTSGESASCDADCTAVVCGDGTTNTTAGETCDTSGESASCDADCTAVVCGDGTTNTTAGETCDTSGESASCDADCTAVVCGDGTTNTTAGETCDTSGESASCDADCTAVVCGDGTTNTTAGEECDDGVNNSDTLPDACRTSCLAAFCGDSVTDTGEQCDDGNTTPGDGCDASCQLEP